MSNTPDYLEINDDHVVITLKKGLEIDGVKTNTITMREPTVKDTLAMDAMKGTDAQKEIGYFANLCSLAPSDLEGLTQRDYLRLQKAYQNFTD